MDTHDALKEDLAEWVDHRVSAMVEDFDVEMPIAEDFLLLVAVTDAAGGREVSYYRSVSSSSSYHRMAGLLAVAEDAMSPLASESDDE